MEGLLSKPHYSRAETMALLGIRETKLWQLQKSGDLNVVHIGRRVFITTKSLLSFLEKIENVG